MQSNRYTWSIVLALIIAAYVPPTLAQAQEGAPQPTTTPAPEQKNLFTNTVEEQEKAWITIDGKRLLALYLNENSGKAHGGVLMISDAGRHPNAQGITNSLRYALSDHHWHTLAIDTALSTNANGSINQDQAQKTIQAGIAYLNEKGVYNIAILGEGFGAVLALKYVATLTNNESSASTPQQIRALIMINAKNTIPYSDTQVLPIFQNVQIPVLDAYSGSDYHNQALARQRKRVGQKFISRYYQQIRLAQTAQFQQPIENRTTKQIRGWLDKNIAGFMVQERGSN